MISEWKWETDRHGDALWHGDTFLGCTYQRRTGIPEEWRVLIGEDMNLVSDVRAGDVLADSHRVGSTLDSINPIRMYARLVLESAAGRG